MSWVMWWRLQWGYLHFSFIEFLHRYYNIIEQETGRVGVATREGNRDVWRVGILRQQSELGPGEKMKMFAMLLHCGLHVKHNFFIEENLNRICISVKRFLLIFTDLEFDVFRHSIFIFSPRCEEQWKYYFKIWITGDGEISWKQENWLESWIQKICFTW